MTVDLNKAKVGDRVELRKGSVTKISRIEPMSGFNEGLNAYDIGLQLWGDNTSGWYAADGRYFPNNHMGNEQPDDIIKLHNRGGSAMKTDIKYEKITSPIETITMSNLLGTAPDVLLENRPDGYIFIKAGCSEGYFHKDDVKILAENLNKIIGQGE